MNGSCVAHPPVATNGQTVGQRHVNGDYSFFQLAAVLSSGDRAFLPGKYTTSIVAGSTTTKQEISLAEGDLGEIALSLPAIGQVPDLFNVTLTLTDPRELPTPTNPTISSSCGGDRSYTLPAAATGTVTLKAFKNAGCTYALNVGGRTVTLDQSQNNTMTLRRLDVDNVEVTREDGSKYQTQGTYELYFGGNRVVGPNTTNSGVDLLPGTYELVIKYSTADGAKTQRETLTL